MGKHRKDYTETIQEILQEATDWKSKTNVMNRANMCHTRFKVYYDALKNLGYLEERERENGKYQCKTTQEGLEVLNSIKKTSLLLEKIKKLI